MAEIVRVPEVKSNLNLILCLLHDTVTFHCKLATEILTEIDDELEFLQEYDKRWNAFVASMVKVDKLFAPLAQMVNKVGKKLFPNYPRHPQFSFLRFFVCIWKREVYGY